MGEIRIFNTKTLGFLILWTYPYLKGAYLYITIESETSTILLFKTVSQSWNYFYFSFGAYINKANFPLFILHYLIPPNFKFLDQILCFTVGISMSGLNLNSQILPCPISRIHFKRGGLIYYLIQIPHYMKGKVRPRSYVIFPKVQEILGPLFDF